MTNNDGIILDSAEDQTNTWIAASGTDAWVAESVLKPTPTQYTLYGMENNGAAVKELRDFSTDATALTSNYPAEDAVTVVDSTLAGTDYEHCLSMPMSITSFQCKHSIILLVVVILCL